jgi:hypothetical protein
LCHHWLLLLNWPTWPSIPWPPFLSCFSFHSQSPFLILLGSCSLFLVPMPRPWTSFNGLPVPNSHCSFIPGSHIGLVSIPHRLASVPWLSHSPSLACPVLASLLVLVCGPSPCSSSPILADPCHSLSILASCHLSLPILIHGSLLICPHSPHSCSWFLFIVHGLHWPQSLFTQSLFIGSLFIGLSSPIGSGLSAVCWVINKHGLVISHCIYQSVNQ